MFINTPINESPYQLFGFFAVDLALLGIVVLLALVLIARKPKDTA